MLGIDDHYRHVGREEVRKHSGGFIFVYAFRFEDGLLGELLLARGAEQHDAGVVEVIGLEDEAAVCEVAVVGKLHACDAGLVEFGLQVDSSRLTVSAVEDDIVLVAAQRLHFSAGNASTVGEVGFRCGSERQFRCEIAVSGEGFVDEAERCDVAEAAHEAGATEGGPVVDEGRCAGLLGTRDEDIVRARSGDAGRTAGIESKRSTAGVFRVGAVSGVAQYQHLAVLDSVVGDRGELEWSDGAADAVGSTVEQACVVQGRGSAAAGDAQKGKMRLTGKEVAEAFYVLVLCPGEDFVKVCEAVGEMRFCSVPI